MSWKKEAAGSTTKTSSSTSTKDDEDEVAAQKKTTATTTNTKKEGGEDEDEEPGVRQRRIQDEAERKGKVPSGFTVNEQGELEEKVTSVILPQAEQQQQPEAAKEKEPEYKVETKKVQLK